MLCCVDVTGAGVSHGVEMITQHKYGRHITAVSVAITLALPVLFPEQLQGKPSRGVQRCLLGLKPVQKIIPAM
jgi:hypothetical protein